MGVCKEMSLNCENGYSKKRPQTVASLVLKQKKTAETFKLDIAFNSETY